MNAPCALECFCLKNIYFSLENGVANFRTTVLCPGHLWKVILVRHETKACDFFFFLDWLFQGEKIFPKPSQLLFQRKQHNKATAGRHFFSSQHLIIELIGKYNVCRPFSCYMLPFAIFVKRMPQSNWVVTQEK